MFEEALANIIDSLISGCGSEAEALRLVTELLCSLMTEDELYSRIMDSKYLS